jgi:HB1, ASXL, restriction endonuclease HTH domain
MNYVEAAIAALRSARRPLTTTELTELAITKGLIKPASKTPVATMRAALYCHLVAVAETPIQKEFEAGRTRARRGSVRWTLKHGANDRR